MLQFFPKKTVNIPSHPDEQWSITRVGRGKTSASINNQFQALVPKNTNATTGNIVAIDGVAYFVLTLEKSFVNTICQLRRTNATISIVSIEKHFTPTKVNDYDYELPMHDNVTSFYEDINGRMALYDIGLKATATRRFIVPVLPMKLTDRVKFNGENMLVEVINSSAYPGLLQIQCSPDNRKTKAVTP